MSITAIAVLATISATVFVLAGVLWTIYELSDKDESLLRVLIGLVRWYWLELKGRYRSIPRRNGGQ